MMYLFLTNHRQDVLTSSRKITARKRWEDVRDIKEGAQFGGLKNVRIGTFCPPTECYPIGDQSDGVLHAQINLRDDPFRGVGSCQRCKCSGNSPRCSGRCRGWWSSSRPGRCRCGRFCGSGYRHGRRDSWSSTDYSCSRCEDVHRFWPHNHGIKNSRGEEVREVSTPA